MPGKLTPEQHEKVVALLHDGSLTYQSIADAFDITTAAVVYHARKAGLLRQPEPREPAPGERAAKRAAHHHEATFPGLNLPGPWADDALCAQVDPDLFFPEKGGDVRGPISVCRRCPVAAECLDYALTNGERHGVWGGLSERPRRKLLTPPPA